jgi:hypothetical protein
VLVTEILPVPVVIVGVRDADEPVEHVGKLVAPAGAEVNAQLSATLPV